MRYISKTLIRLAISLGIALSEAYLILLHARLDNK